MKKEENTVKAKYRRKAKKKSKKNLEGGKKKDVFPRGGKKG